MASLAMISNLFFKTGPEGEGGGGNLPRFWVDKRPGKAKSRPITRAKLSQKKHKTPLKIT